MYSSWKMQMYGKMKFGFQQQGLVIPWFMGSFLEIIHKHIVGMYRSAKCTPILRIQKSGIFTAVNYHILKMCY